MPTSPPTITPVPTPVPSTSDPANFDARADALLGWFPGGVDEIQAVADNVYDNAVEAHSDALAAAASQTGAEAAQELAIAATDYIATSTSSLDLTAGTKTVALVEAGKALEEGDEVALIYRANSSVRLYGAVASVVGQTLTVDVASGGIEGSGGPYSDWIVINAALLPQGATASEARALTSDKVALTPKSIKDAMEEVALTDASSISVDFSAGYNFGVTLGGNRTLANPSNMKVGQSGFIRVTQDATGSRTLAYGSYWDRPGGAPTLTTTAGAVDFLFYIVVSSTRIVYGLAKAPS